MRALPAWPSVLTSPILPRVLLLVSLSVAFCRPAEAQTPAVPAPSGADAAEAPRRFKAGLKLYGEKAYTEALAEFEASYRLGGRPSALRNVAQCHRDLKHFADAYEAYERLLKLHGAQLSTADRDVVGRALDELSDLSGSVAVSTQSGATIELDGKTLGIAPLDGVKRVSLGLHRVRVTLPGFEPFEKDVSIQSGTKAAVTATLSSEVMSGHVAVRELNGDPVDVYIDGVDKGPAPWEGDLAPGEHTLEAKGALFAAEKSTFTVVKKGRLDLSLDATTTQGHVRLSTLPASATIGFDGRNVGTGLYDADVAPGVHRVEVTMTGFGGAVRELSVQRGQLFVQDIVLQPETVESPYGVYVRLAPFGLASPTATNLYSAGGSTRFHGGLGATLRLGYGLGVVGIEIATAFLVDQYGENLDGQSPAHGPNGVLGTGGFFGLGARATSRGGVARVTAGVSPGVSVRSIVVQTNAASTGSCNGGLSPCPTPSGTGGLSGGYAAPGLLFDAGVLVGRVPGAQLFVGAQAMFDFPGTLALGPDVVDTQIASSAFFPGRTVRAISGPQVFVGPTLGVQLGR